MHLAPTNRIPRLFAALACFAVFAAIAALLVLQWPPILKLDESISKWPQQVAADNQSLGSFFKWLGTFTGTRAQTVYTVIIAVLLLIKKQHRAAIWTIAVMVTVGIAIPLLKRVFERDRPQWSDPVVTLHNYSFPSGHAVGISAMASIAVVLSLLLVRKRGLRRTLIVGSVAFALLVGADRIFLGVHYLRCDRRVCPGHGNSPALVGDLRPQSEDDCREARPTAAGQSRRAQWPCGRRTQPDQG
ncbi:MAG: phosphatase PAP2 family protein [Marmoricola sp.]